MDFSLAVASGDYFLVSVSRLGVSLQWLLLLQSTGSRRSGSVVVAHRLSFSLACGILEQE